MKTNIEKEYEIGYPTFEKLFKMSDVELKNILKEFVNSPYDENFFKNADIEKTIYNGKYNQIKITFYDMIIISPFGIITKQEHSLNGEQVVKFNKYFKL